MLQSLALIIGIDDYKHYGHLRCAVNDAKAVEDTLKKLRYKTYSLYNNQATRDSYKTYVDSITRELIENKTDVFVFYFAGHGSMHNNEDCLKLHDTECCEGRQYDVLIRNQSIVLKELCNSLRASGDQMNIIIIDACRTDTNDTTRGGDIIIAKEFGKNTTLPYQTFMAFSTSPGAPAKEPKNGEHTKFTAALLDEMMKENQPIETTFKEIRKKIYHGYGEQLPCESSCLVDEFSFNHGQLDPRNIVGFSKDVYDYKHYHSSIIDNYNNVSGKNDVQGLYGFIIRESKSLNEDDAFVLGANLGSLVYTAKDAQSVLNATKLRMLNSNVFKGFLYALYYSDNQNIREENVPKWLLNIFPIITNDEGFLDSFNFINLFDELRSQRLYVLGDKDNKVIDIELKESENYVEYEIYELVSLTCDNNNITDQIKINIDSHTLYDIDTLKNVIRSHIEIPDAMLQIRTSPSRLNNKLISIIPLDKFSPNMITTMIQTYQYKNNKSNAPKPVNSFEHFMEYVNWEELNIEAQEALYDISCNEETIDLGLFYNTKDGEDTILHYRPENVYIKLTPARKRYFPRWLEKTYMNGDDGDTYFAIQKMNDEDSY